MDVTSCETGMNAAKLDMFQCSMFVDLQQLKICLTAVTALFDLPSF